MIVFESGRDREDETERPELEASSFGLSLFIVSRTRGSRSLLALRHQGIEIDEMTQRC